ncbi:transcription repressor OFP17-like [Neltuma alba]|uniref:transcription repressor OFP17-like n=1 Tax=Neltuma alba TaxID=207710 RepID=UPI0010A45503|nr:transcription repressor OFP17-like [Prosopis alba]
MSFSPSPSFFSVFRSPKRSPKHTKNKVERDLDHHHAGPSIDAPEVEAVVFPSPLTIVYNNGGESDRRIMREGGGGGDNGDDVEVEEACRRFEKHLVEMIVEERKTKDLMDVEELLCCWKKLKNPVFVDLVCGFYGELCKDLFSSQTIHEKS